MNKIDLHIHTTFSTDSKLKPDDLIEKAIANGYSTIGITDHFDIIAESVSTHTQLPYPDYCVKIDELKARFPQIEIVQGAEVGEMHWFKEELNEIFSYRDPEYIISSVHFLSNRREISTPFSGYLTNDEQLDYYKMNLDMVTNADFEILGHLGIYNRYRKHDDSCCLDLKRRILKTIITKGIALEVNSSALSKPLAQTIPTTEDLKLYFDMGGDLVSIGSDAHDIDLFDKHYEETMTLLQTLNPNYKLYIPKEAKCK